MKADYGPPQMPGPARALRTIRLVVLTTLSCFRLFLPLISPSVVCAQSGDLVPSRKESIEEKIAYLRKALKDPDPTTKKVAVQMLAEFGPLAKEAVPDLVEHLLDPAIENWQEVRLAIQQIATRPPAELDKRLESAHAEQRLRIYIILLDAYSGDPDNANRIVCRALRDSHPNCQWQAMGCVMSKLKAKASKAVPILIDLIQNDKNEATRRGAIQTVQCIGSAEAAPAIPCVDAILRNRRNSDALREIAADALGVIGSDNPNVAAILKSHLVDQSNPHYLRQSCVFGLQHSKHGQSAME